MTNPDDGTYFSVLAVACRRFGLDDANLAEAVLHAVDAGWAEQEAVKMTLTKYLEMRGLYHGELRELVDSGRVFQVGEVVNMTSHQPHPEIIANKAISRPVAANGLRGYTKYRPGNLRGLKIGHYNDTMDKAATSWIRERQIATFGIWIFCTIR